MPTPNLKEIEWAISELEQQESSEARYTLLAALYTCRKELSGVNSVDFPVTYSAASPPPQKTVKQYGNSDFLQAVAGADPAAAWGVMDELMDTLRVVRPQVYESVMRKITRA